MTHPLESARLKIARARERLHEMDREAAAFLDTHPYVAVSDQDGDSDLFTLRCRVFQTPPISLGMIAGDLAHNLRSALDHIVYQLAALGVAGEQGRGEKTQFPIFDDIAKFESWKPVYLKGVRDVDIDTLRALQPLDDPDDLLLVLRNLDDRDKHRVVDAVVSIMGKVHLNWQTGTTIHEFIPAVPLDQHLNLDDGTKLGTYRATAIDGNVRVYTKIDPALAFRFTEKRAVQVTEFPKMIDTVAAIFAKFADSFPPAHDAAPAGAAPAMGGSPSPPSDSPESVPESPEPASQPASEWNA